MKRTMLKSGLVLAVIISNTVSVNSSLLNLPSAPYQPTNYVIKVETAAKANQINNVIKSGANRCVGVSVPERTDCVADVLKKARAEINRQRFANAKLKRLFKNAERDMRKLPDTGSPDSLRQGRVIIDQLSVDIKLFAKTRPLDYQRHNIAVAIAIPSLKKPLNPKRT